MTFQEPQRIKNILQDYHGTWLVAGGWAIDLFLQKETRPHHDIEIAIPRREQLKLKAFLKNWKLRFVTSGKFMDWKEDVFLELPIHEIHGKNANDESIEILLNEMDDLNWKFRRDQKIRYSIHKTILINELQIPFLCPEIVLLYKAKFQEEKDTSDFLQVLPELKPAIRIWLKQSIIKSHGDHPWLRYFK